MKKVIAVSALAMCFSVSAFAQQLTADTKKKEEPFVLDVHASVIKNEVGVPYIQKRQPGIQLEGTLNSKNTFGQAQLNMIPKSIDQKARVFGSLNAYRRTGKQLWDNDIMAGLRMNALPMGTSVAPSIAVMNEYNALNIHDQRILFGVQPIGYFQTNQPQAEKPEADRHFRAATSSLVLEGKGPVNGSGAINASINMNIGMLYGGSSKTGEFQSKQKGLGSNIAFGVGLEVPVSQRVSIDGSYQFSFQSYKVETTNLAKNTAELNKRSASNYQLRLGVHYLIDGKAKGKAAKVL